MSSIASMILEIVSKKLPVSDLHIVEGRPLLGRWPRGYQSISKDYVISQKDIDEFLSMDGVMGKNWKDILAKKEGTFRVAQTLSSARVRLSIYEGGGSKRSISIIGRIIPREIPDARELGIPAAVLNVMQQSKGLFVVTGPTGSGKSTTMAAMLQTVNSGRPVHILTLEDPIEYEFPVEKAVVSQREVGASANVPSFRDGLEQALTQRPDIIAIGEVKDADSVRSMLRAAESGHLVLATMHTRNSEETITALLSYLNKDEVPQVAQSLAGSLIGVTTQVLVPSVDGSKYHLASEIMLNNKAISQAIRDVKPMQIRNAIAQGGSDGMVLLNANLADLAEKGKVLKRDAVFASYDTQDLVSKIGLK